MLNSRFWLILLGLLAWGSTAFCQDEETAIVGSIPYTNQWKFEDLGSFFYFTYNQERMAETSLQVNHYTANFSQNSSYPTIDYFIRMAQLADPEGTSAKRFFSLWGRYSLGFNVKEGTLTNGDFQLSDVSQTGYLAHGVMRLGLNLTYERLRNLWPYFGLGAVFAGYRHTAAIGGAEAQGGSIGYELMGGLHFPGLFQRRISLYVEGRYTQLLSTNTPVYSNGLFAAAGLGFSI